MRMKKQFGLLVAMAIACGAPASFSTPSTGFTAVAQSNNGKVSGVIKDDKGEPLIGASVKVKGTNRGTVTDLDGFYSIQAPANATLEVSYVGYKTITVPASKAGEIVLSSSATLDEVVITAEFGMKRVARAVGSSVQNVKATDIAESGRTDFITALQGRVSGMTVTSTSGAPGASTQVILRSATSLSGNNQPLYVIDGIPMNNTTFNGTNSFASGDSSGSSVRDGDFASRGNDINPEDIESMTVLKGAAAAALYGSDASNGAIIITTKKGTNGAAKVTYSNQLSFQKAYGWPEIQRKYANGAYGATNYYYTSAWGGPFTGEYETYDNVKAILQTGFLQKHNISVQAGNDKMSVRASASFIDQDGVIKTTNLNRKNLSLAGKGQITKWLAFDASMQYVHLTNNKVDRFTAGPLYRAYLWPHVDNMANWLHEDGIHMRYPEHYTDTDLLNPLYKMYKGLNKDQTDRFISAMNFNITPFEGAYIRGQFGWDVSTSQYEYGNHPYYTSTNLAVTKGGSYNISKYNTSDPTVNVLVGYNNTFDNVHSVGAQLGFHSVENGVTSLASSGSDFQLLDFYSINNCNPATVVSKKRNTKRRVIGLSGQFEYGYNNMAFATFRFREDKSSTLPKDNNTYFYPAVELSWVLTELPGLKDNNALNYFKLRGSWAKVGKDAPALSIDPELEATGLTGGGYKYGFTGPNKALKPEMNTSWEVGFEARAWNNRLNADFTYFKTKCEDQIVTGFRMSYATGFVLNNMNVGSFTTNGWEAHIDADLVKAGDFTWNLGINASHTTSKVVYLPENLTEYYNAYTWNSGNIRNGIMLGQPITTVTGRAFRRNDKGEILISPSTGLPLVDASWSVLGDREPDLRFGITTALSYKDFRLSAMFSGRLGATMVNGTAREMMNRGLSDYSVQFREHADSYVFNGVYQDGHENPKYDENGVEIPGSYNPNRNTIAIQTTTGSASTWVDDYDELWVQKGINYLRLQELRLNYNIPAKFLKEFTHGFISRAQIYVAGNDLFTLTNYTGYDVVGNVMSAAAGGVGGEGYDCWSLPSPRTYTFGLSVTF